MYQQFYRFSRNPFAAPADASQIFLAEAHRDALSALVLDVQNCRPFVAVSGDGEVGKTTVLNAALASLPGRQQHSMRVTRMDRARFAHLGARQIVGQIIGEQDGGPTDDDLERLSRELLNGRDGASQHVLVIDDLHAVNPSALRLLQLLSNVKPRDTPVVQVVFAGRHEFWETLANDECSPIRGEAVARSVVDPLGEDEVRQYIDYRLHLAGSSIAQVMTDAALTGVMRHGQALPGRINRVLDHAFTLGAVQRRARITPQVVDEAVAQPQFANRPPPTRIVAARAPARTVSPAVLVRRDAAEWPARQADATRGVVERRASAVTRRRLGWLGAAAAAVVLGLGLSMRVPHRDVAGDPMAASVAPHEVAAVAPAAVNEAPVADRQAPDRAGEGGAQAPASAKAAEAAAGAPAERVAAPVTPIPVTEPAAPPEFSNASGAVPPAAIASAPAAPSVDGENAARSDSGPPATDPAPAPVSHPDIAASSGPRAADGQAEERGTGLAAASPPTQAAGGPDGTVALGSAAAPVVARLPAERLAMLQQRGAAMLAVGDISAARTLYARAAEGGSGPAAEEIGKTYDPRFLADWHVVGLQPDPVMAAGWYRRAIGLGDAGAAGLLEGPITSSVHFRPNFRTQHERAMRLTVAF